MNEWSPDEEEEEGDDDKGMVHLEVVWEEVEVFFSNFWQMSVTDTFYMKFYEKDGKKNNKLWYWIVVYHS